MSIMKLVRDVGIGLNIANFPDYHIKQRSLKFHEFLQHVQAMNELNTLVCDVMMQRTALELDYSKQIAKLSSKLEKFSKEKNSNSLFAWLEIAQFFDRESQLHKESAMNFDKLVTRKLLAASEAVAKSSQSIMELEMKAFKQLDHELKNSYLLKVNCFNNQKTAEKAFEKLKAINVESLPHQNNKSKLTSESLNKMEEHCSKLDREVIKTERDYYESCLQAEASRETWLEIIYQGHNLLVIIENDRIKNFETSIGQYLDHEVSMHSKLQDCISDTRSTLKFIDIKADRNVGEHFQELILKEHKLYLPDLYIEGLSNNMSNDRRIMAALRVVGYLQEDIKKEMAKEMGKFENDFVDYELMSMPNDLSREIGSALLYLEATLYKLAKLLTDLGVEVTFIYESLQPEEIDVNYEVEKNKKGIPQTFYSIQSES